MLIFVDIATPFVASSPHFYFGDPRLSEMLKLKPEKTVHATFLDVEPVSMFYLIG